MEIAHTLAPFSLIFWALLVIFAALFKGVLKVNGVPVESTLGRVLVTPVIVLVIGLAFSILGMIGFFLLSPIISLF